MYFVYCKNSFAIKLNTMKNIENHKTAAKHHEEAAKNHHEAIKHIEAGHHEKAADSTVKAHGHATMASESQREVLKNHTK